VLFNLIRFEIRYLHEVQDIHILPRVGRHQWSIKPEQVDVSDWSRFVLFFHVFSFLSKSISEAVAGRQAQLDGIYGG
jgi:hypothetical protein